MRAVIAALSKTLGLVDAPPPLASMGSGWTGQGLDAAMRLLGTQHLEGSAGPDGKPCNCSLRWVDRQTCISGTTAACCVACWGDRG